MGDTRQDRPADEPVLTPDQEREARWRRHRVDLQRYVGQWVVVEDDRVVASAWSASEAEGAARAAGVEFPLVFQVEAGMLRQLRYPPDGGD